jgi:hypothetical protein
MKEIATKDVKRVDCHPDDYDHVRACVDIACLRHDIEEHLPVWCSEKINAGHYVMQMEGGYKIEGILDRPQTA